MYDAQLIQQLVTVAERAAVACHPTIGKDDRTYSDKVATEAMRETFNAIPIKGTVVIGEGERDEAPMLFIGEQVGSGEGPEVDIAVDPLEGTNLCATGAPNAVCVFAMTQHGGFTAAPDMYMDKLCVGPRAAGKVHLSMTAEEIVQILADAHTLQPSEIVIAMLERDRHEERMKAVQKTGAQVHLFSDGDILQGIRTCIPDQNVHALWNIGASAEGVIKAAAMKTMGGAIEVQFQPRSDEERDRLESMGTDAERIYKTDDLAQGDDVLCIISGVTDGEVLQGTHEENGHITVQTLIMQSAGSKLEKVTHSFEQ